MIRPAVYLAAVLAATAGLWAYIDTHAYLLPESAEGAHDWSEL